MSVCRRWPGLTLTRTNCYKTLKSEESALGTVDTDVRVTFRKIYSLMSQNEAGTGAMDHYTHLHFDSGCFLISQIFSNSRD